jgi:hypothetical protein
MTTQVFFPYSGPANNEDIPVFTEQEMTELCQLLRESAIVTTDRMGGCAGIIRDSDGNYKETLVTYDGIHWHMGLNPHHGCRRIDETSLEDAIRWYNEVYNKREKPLREEKHHYGVGMDFFCQ